MTDKNKIRAEIERLLNKEWSLSDSTEAKYRNEAYRELLDFIDSLPKESVSEDLEEEVDEYILDNFDDAEGRVYVLQCARHFANWQKEQMMRDTITTVVTENYGVDKIDGERRRVSQNKITVFPNNVSIGDKVKLIIIKEDDYGRTI